MLRGQDFRRSHERRLISVLDGDHCSFERDQRLARTNVALQQAAHGNRRLHVRRDLAQNFLLRTRWPKGQKSLDRFANAVVQLKRNSGTAPKVAALQLQSDFKKKQLLEDESPMRRSIASFQVGKALAHIGKVSLLECVPA